MSGNAVSFGNLPGELYSAIISHLPAEYVQQTILSLTRTLPDAPISLYRLYEHIRVIKPSQAISLQSHFRKLKNAAAGPGQEPSRSPLTWVHHLTIESWMVDADVVLNVIKMLPDLTSLSLWIGPSNFTPEHLEEAFSRPFSNLTYLGLRFRPYVKKATYYQFLKGAYFDSALVALSRWPVHHLPVLSIVQDPFKVDPSMELPGRHQGFAQPIVFFKFETCLPVLMQSAAFSQSLNAFRLRIPSRPIARSLCHPPLMSVNGDGEAVRVPKLEIMDLSTSGVMEGEVDLLLVHYKNLQHLVLDECPILRGELREGEWSAMGKRCALAGTRRAKECEQALADWYERWVIATASPGGDTAPATMMDLGRRVRPGRRGLSTPTISIRSHSPLQPRRGGGQPAVTVRQSMPKFRVLPPIPSLRTLCATPSPSVPLDAYSTIRSEFEAGWAEGIAQLAVRRARMRDSAKVGTKILRFAEGNPTPPSPEGDWSGLFTYAGTHGLELVDEADIEAFDTFGCSSGDPKDILAPILCLSGNQEDGVHVEKCGHSVVAQIWPSLVQ